MKRFTKNVLYGLFHFYSPEGRDSRQTFCDICKGFFLLALFGMFLSTWRNTLAVMSVLDFLAITPYGCWVLCIIFELMLLAGFACATIRRWQDLGIQIPKNDSVTALIQRPRFWEVLLSEEGSREKNEHGEAPEDNPIPLISEHDLKNAIRKKLFSDVDDWQELKK